MMRKKRSIAEALAMPKSEGLDNFEFDRIPFNSKDSDPFADDEVKYLAESSNVKGGIIQRAIMVFGDHAKAEKWLNTHNLALGMKPKDMLDRENGPKEVAKILKAIEAGGVV